MISHPIKICWQQILALFTAFFFVGCMGSPFPARVYNVSSNPAWWGELHLGEVLALNQDTLLSGVELTMIAYKITDTYNSTAIFGQNITVEMFKANPGKYWEDLHLIPQGTRLRCVKLERYYSDVISEYMLSVEIQDGDFKGRIVYLNPLEGDPDEKGTLKLGPHSLVHPVE